MDYKLHPFCLELMHIDPKLLTFDKNMSFYTRYIRKSTTDEILDTKINKKTYVPRPYNKGDIPLFFVAVCRK